MKKGREHISIELSGTPVKMRNYVFDVYGLTVKKGIKGNLKRLNGQKINHGFR